MYEAVAYAMRYWFIFVVVGILIAVIYISYKEYTEKKHVMETVGKYHGYLEIVGGPRSFVGDRFGIGQESTIGSANRSDIMLPDRSVQKTHALLYIDDDGELVLSPAKKAATQINGRRATTAHRLKTGDIISIGEVDFSVYIKRTRLTHDA